MYDDHAYWHRRISEDTREKTLESPPPPGYGWSLVYRDGERRPAEDRLVLLLGYDPVAVFIEGHKRRMMADSASEKTQHSPESMSTDDGWRFGFGPCTAESAWCCQRCSTIMLKNQRACPACAYTVFDPIHRRAQSRKDMT